MGDLRFIKTGEFDYGYDYDGNCGVGQVVGCASQIGVGGDGTALLDIGHWTN